MIDVISPASFDHLVKLAALELTPDEAEYLRTQLNNQLKAIRELEAIPFEENLQIASHGVPYTPHSSPPPRADEWIPILNPQEIIDQAPETDQGYIVVPEIPHTDLS